MLSQELEFVLNQAFIKATEKHQEFITIEHLLLALLGNPSAGYREFYRGYQPHIAGR